MQLALKILEEAHDEYIEAYEWYELTQIGLGERFKKNVEKIIQKITEHTEYYGKRNLNYREAKVEEFPFSIVYHFFSRKKIDTYCCHLSPEKKSKEKIPEDRITMLLRIK